MVSEVKHSEISSVFNGLLMLPLLETRNKVSRSNSNEVTLSHPTGLPQCWREDNVGGLILKEKVLKENKFQKFAPPKPTGNTKLSYSWLVSFKHSTLLSMYFLNLQHICNQILCCIKLTRYIVQHACNPSIQETGESECQDSHWLHNKFAATLGWMRLKKQNKAMILNFLKMLSDSNLNPTRNTC